MDNLKLDNKMDIKTLDKILELKQKRLSLREIAVLVKMSPEGVRNAIKKYNWIRGKSKVEKNNLINNKTYANKRRNQTNGKIFQKAIQSNR